MYALKHYQKGDNTSIKILKIHKIYFSKINFLMKDEVR